MFEKSPSSRRIPDALFEKYPAVCSVAAEYRRRQRIKRPSKLDERLASFTREENERLRWDQIIALWNMPEPSQHSEVLS